jgi:Kef-type K+ transport system membrane component KefB
VIKIRRGHLFESVRGAALLAVLAFLVFAVRAATPVADAHSLTLVGLGLVIFAGYLTAHLVERVGVPHLTGYILAGLALGPHALGLVSTETIHGLRPTTSLALALIALTAGAELSFSLLRRGARSLAFAISAHFLVVLPATFGAMLAIKRFLPFLAPLPLSAAAVAALLWGVIAMSRSPSSTLGVISQLRPSGPLTRHVLSVVISMDLMVLVSFSMAMLLAASVLDPTGAPVSSALRELGTTLMGSLACGTTLGLFIALWLRLVKKQLLLFLLVVAYAGTQLAAYFHFEPLLLFLTAGFVVSNVTGQGEELLDLVSAGGQIVFVVFFALAGAKVDLALIAQVWPLALTLWLARALSTVAGSRAAARLAGDDPAVRRYAGLSLLSQAGTTITLSTAVGDRFPALAGLSTLLVAVAALDELSGPLLFKWSLDRAGESSKAARAALWTNKPAQAQQT